MRAITTRACEACGSALGRAARGECQQKERFKMLKTVSLFIAIVASAGILSGQAIAAEWALGAALPQHLQQSEPPPAKQCQPSIWGLLLSAGWAYATKSPIPTHEPRPCPDNLQEVRKRAQAQEARDAPA